MQDAPSFTSGILRIIMLQSFSDSMRLHQSQWPTSVQHLRQYDWKRLRSHWWSGILHFWHTVRAHKLHFAAVTFH